MQHIYSHVTISKQQHVLVQFRITELKKYMPGQIILEKLLFKNIILQKEDAAMSQATESEMQSIHLFQTGK